MKTFKTFPRFELIVMTNFDSIEKKLVNNKLFILKSRIFSLIVNDCIKLNQSKFWVYKNEIKKKFTITTIIYREIS